MLRLQPKRIHILIWIYATLVLSLAQDAISETAVSLDFDLSIKDTNMDVCQIGIIIHKFTDWQKTDTHPPNPFMSVEQIKTDIHPPAVALLENIGCNSEYLWEFLSCTQTDFSNAPHLSSTDGQVDTLTQLENLISDCINELNDKGITTNWIDN